MDNEMNLKLFIFSQMSFDDGYRAGCVIAENEEEAKACLVFLCSKAFNVSFIFKSPILV